MLNKNIVIIINMKMIQDLINKYLGRTEGFSTYVSESGNEEKSYNTYLLQFYLIVIAIRLAFVFIVWKFLWPNVMPKIASNIKAKPTFVSLLGLSMIYSLLF
tara:strand:+ start:983 stop:1288 length:306 start_codon:yes stop_codon:yes gene_type:complete